MNNTKTTNKVDNKEFITIDTTHILKTLWHKAWLIVLVSILVAAVGFFKAAFFTPQQYESSVLLYVNNSSFSLGEAQIKFSSSEISAARSLVQTYIVILKNRTTLEKVIDKENLDYSYEELCSMISANAVNDTEVLRVTVRTTNPKEASNIANKIAEVLPQRISEVIEGSSVKVVDEAVPNNQKVAPSVSNYTLVGFIVGFVFAVAVLVIIALMDDTVHDDEYIIQNYDYPILAKIPNLIDSSGGKYSYYGRNVRQTKAGNSNGKQQS